ncbi:hypothetical protein CMK10_11365, partial [Candidatus Poribacteria bacterium]|nr:hypothetical protein [Candidatus Poribacteria bacterium]
MRKLIAFFSAVLLCSVGSIAFGVGFLKFEREFSGKGASSGFFGKEINVAFDTKGNTYVADSQNRLIQKISPKGDFLDQILMVDDTTAFKEPGDIAVDSAGNIYVADTAANHIAETENPKIYIFAPCVYKFDALGENVHTYFVGNVSVRPKTVLPAKLIIDEAGRSAFAIQSPGYDRQIKIAVNGDSELYILDPVKTKVHKFAADGKKLTSFSSYGAGNGEIDKGASDIGVDAEGNVFIADTDNHRIVKFNSEGEFLFNFGAHGRDDGELTKPSSIVVLNNGNILIKDASQFKRFNKKFTISDILAASPAASGLADPLSDSTTLGSGILPDSSFSRVFSNFPATQSELVQRVQLLEELEYLRRYEGYYDGAGKGADKDIDADLQAETVKSTYWHRVTSRIQHFDANGKYLGRFLYSVDKQNEQDRDLNFLAFDPFGNVYLRDGSDFTIKQYSINGFTVKASQANGFLNANFSTFNQEMLEDYEDVDKVPELQNEVGQSRLNNSLGMVYDVSEKLNFSLFEDSAFSKMQERYSILSKKEDSHELSTLSFDSTARASVTLITNPNPYSYKEFNLYVVRMDGTTDLLKEGAYPELNKQKETDDGNKHSYGFGLNWDLLRKNNTNINFGV